MNERDFHGAGCPGCNSLTGLTGMTGTDTQTPLADEDDKPRDECGVVGLFGVDNAARHAALGLHALQHRGQESAGVVSAHLGILHAHRGMGLVSAVFGKGEALALPGSSAVGHVRYSTAGGSNFANAQPLLGRYSSGQVALAHNGNLAGGDGLREELLGSGAFLQTTSDSEYFLHLLAQKHAETDADIAEVFSRAGAAFSVVLLYPDRLIAARDPWGYRPLVLGRMGGGTEIGASGQVGCAPESGGDTDAPAGDAISGGPHGPREASENGQGWVVASETCAFDQIGARYEREIEPGEMVTISAEGIRSTFFGQRQGPRQQCLLELIYFARPDSVVFGHTPHVFRRKSGRILAQEHPAKADIVVGIPDSGFSAAMGYAEELGLPLDRGLIRNHYIGRSFIAPGQAARAAAVRMKHNVVAEVVAGKRVVLVDDSLIRGTTTAALGRELRAAGATEVHLRIACPPTRHPCLYGVDFPLHQELMAYKHSLEEIRRLLNMNSLGYLSLTGMDKALEGEGAQYCTACWSGRYLNG